MTITSPSNGRVERLNRTLKGLVIWACSCADLDELREATAAFIEHYNNCWLV